MERGTVVGFSVDLLAVHRDFMNGSLTHIAHELRKADFFFFLSAAALLNYLPQEEGGQPNYQPESYGFDCRIHQYTPKETGILPAARTFRGSCH
jgi:hypothetical protein